MPIENRSKFRQVIYLILVFFLLIAALRFFAR